MTTFNYTQLDAETEAFLREQTTTLKLLTCKTAALVIEIGQALIDVKAVLPHGQFQDWLQAEFDWGDRTARRYMDIAERFGGKTDTVSVLNIPLKVLYLLASPAVDDETVDTVLRIAQENGGLTYRDAKELIRPEEEGKYIQYPPDEPYRLGPEHALWLPNAALTGPEYPDNPADHQTNDPLVPITMTMTRTTRETREELTVSYQLPRHLHRVIYLKPIQAVHQPRRIESALNQLNEIYLAATGRYYFTPPAQEN